MIVVQGQSSVTVGGQVLNNVNDSANESLLGKILKELKIMNIHLAKVSDEKITRSDI